MLVEAGHLVELAVDRRRQLKGAGPDDLPFHALPLLIEGLDHGLRHDDVVRIAYQERKIGLRVLEVRHDGRCILRFEALDVAEETLAGADDAAWWLAYALEA